MTLYNYLWIYEPLGSLLRLYEWHGCRYHYPHPGWSQVFVMQPFEIIKVRLQTQSKANPQYTGIVDCLSKIIKNEGPLALYKGTIPVTQAPSPL